MTAQKTWKTTTLAVMGSLIAALATWGAASYDASKLDTTRFATDSTRRDAIDQRSLELLNRIDARVRPMYCEGKPPGFSNGA
jgi:hypothetical protein